MRDRAPDIGHASAFGFHAVSVAARKLLRLVAPEGSLRGRLEGISRGQVHGWVYGSQPAGPLLIRLTTDEGCAIDLRADRYRADLAAAGMGDGHCGFAAPASAFGSARLIRATVAATGFELANSPLSLERADGLLVGRQGSIGFGVDRPATLARVTGWAIDRSDPGRRLLVGLRSRGRIVVEAQATRFRTEAAVDGGDALHGFVLACPGLKAKQAEVVALDAGATLARLRART